MKDLMKDWDFKKYPLTKQIALAALAMAALAFLPLFVAFLFQIAVALFILLAIGAIAAFAYESFKNLQARR
jgi:hypothetical protein